MSFKIYLPPLETLSDFFKMLVKVIPCFHYLSLKTTISLTLLRIICK